MKLSPFNLLSKTGLKGLFLFLLLQISSVVGAQVSVENQVDPKILYKRMLESRQNYDFNGVFVYEEGGDIRTFDIESSFKEGQVNQALDVLDGATQQYRMSFNNLCAEDEVSISEQLSPYYNFYVSGEERVAGLTGVEIVLAPIDKFRYGYQYVIEPESGMMLRSITLTPERQMLERIQFTQIDFQLTESFVVNNESKELATTVPSADSSLNNELGETVLETESREKSTDYSKINCGGLSIDNGWSTSWLPEGFSPLSTSFDGERATLVYSDGVATMSIFIEGVLDSFLPPSKAQRGATMIYINYLSNPSATYLVSIVGEVPLATAEKVLVSLQRN